MYQIHGITYTYGIDRNEQPIGLINTERGALFLSGDAVLEFLYVVQVIGGTKDPVTRRELEAALINQVDCGIATEGLDEPGKTIAIGLLKSGWRGTPETMLTIINDLLAYQDGPDTI